MRFAPFVDGFEGFSDGAVAVTMAEIFRRNVAA